MTKIDAAPVERCKTCSGSADNPHRLCANPFHEQDTAEIVLELQDSCLDWTRCQAGQTCLNCRAAAHIEEQAAEIERLTRSRDYNRSDAEREAVNAHYHREKREQAEALLKDMQVCDGDVPEGLSYRWQCEIKLRRRRTKQAERNLAIVRAERDELRRGINEALDEIKIMLTITPEGVLHRLRALAKGDGE